MKNLDRFKKTLEKSLILDLSEKELFQKIPDTIWEKIFERNFNGNINTASRILLNDFDEVDAIDVARVDKEKLKIQNLKKSTEMFNNFVKSRDKIVFVTDNDNDGSLSQAGIIEFMKCLDDKDKKNIFVEYSQALNGNKSRGFTIDLIDLFAEKNKIKSNEKFLIVTADNGINSVEEQKKIQEKYPNAHIIITDHHMPDVDEVIKENNKTVIFNPKYKPTKFFENKNISGANTVCVLLKNIAKELYPENTDLVKSVEFKNMDEISKIANMLDYVDTDIADKPLRNYIIEKAAKVGTLLNVNNSLNKIITGELSKGLIETLTANIEGLDVAKVQEQIDNIKRQNIFASKLLNMHEKYAQDSESYNIDTFLDLLAIELEHTDDLHETINPNYIEQLRPLIFNYTSIDNKNIFENQLNETMIKVFEEVRNAEKNLFVEIRKGKVMHAEKLEHSTILYPIDENITKVFNRKFLGKAYNEENNGFLMILDNIEKHRVSGSFRSLHRIQDILEGKEMIEKALGVDLDFMGHDKAAGFFITSKDNSEITPRIITEVNKYINKRIDTLLKNEQSSDVEYVLSDLDSLAIIDKINQKVKGNLSNMVSISPIVKFNNNTYLTDTRTSEQNSLQQLVKDKKYGYVTVKMNFNDDAIIMPTELVRKIADNNFKDYIKISYMDNGVFMATNVIDHNKVKNIVKVTRGNEEKEELLSYFKDRFLNNNHEVNLTYNMLKDIPYFKNNAYGEKEFARFENLVIRIIESMDADVFSIVDTEGTGLGKAPKCLNLGALNFEVDKESGTSMSLSDFQNAHFKTLHGKAYLLNTQQQSELLEITSSQAENLSFEDRKNLLIKDNDNGYFIHNPSDVSMKNKFDSLLNNFKIEGDVVQVNRKIKSSMYSYLINDTDFKLPQEIIALTGISNRMLNAAGKRTHVVDEEFTKKYEGKKVIFQAHNLPYDLGVIEANMPKLFDKMENSILSDSAIFSRRMKLAYDKVDMATFDSLSSVYFYNSNASEMSVSKFLEKGEDGVFPDRTGFKLLKIKEGNVSVIDRKENNEYDLKKTTEEMINEMTVKDLPNNGIKYSVEQLSLHETIRNLLLAKEAFNIQMIEVPEKLQYLDKEMHYLMENYHFDSTVSENLWHFIEYLDFNDKIYSAKDDISEFLDAFLEKNKDIQMKFSESWMYKKVLTLHDPEKGKITDDLVDILAYQTDLPAEKVKVILQDALFYKEKFGLDHTLVHEVHNNIVYDKEGLGDVVVESVLTLKRLADTNYNSYLHDSEYAVKQFTDNALKTTAQHLQRKMKDLALDSYSAKQARAYTRKLKSGFVEQVNQKDLKVIKFKLDIDILPDDTSVYAIPKKKLSNQDIDNLSEKLTFVLKNEQLLNSLSKSKASLHAKESMQLMLERNIPKCKEYKAEIEQSLDNVYYDRKDGAMKKLTAMLFDVCSNQKISKIPDVVLEQKDQEVLTNMLNNFESAFGKMNYSFNKLAGEAFIKCLNYIEPFELEQKEEAEMQMIENSDGLRDKKFLPSVSISRRNVMSWALKNAPEVIYNTLDKDKEVNMQMTSKNRYKASMFNLKL